MVATRLATEESGDVLEDDAGGIQLLHQSYDLPKEAGAVTIESRSLPRNGQVLAHLYGKPPVTTSTGSASLWTFRGIAL
jgi:hypothetical protein